MLRDWAIWATGWLGWNMVSPTLWPPLAWYWLVPSPTKATGWWFSLVSISPRNTAISMTVYGTPPLTNNHKSLHLPKSLMEYWWSLLFWPQGHLLAAHSHYTPLYPAYNCIQPYHHNFTTYFRLHPHICLNHLVELAYWVENTLEGFWGLLISAHRPQPEITSLNKTSLWNSQHLWWLWGASVTWLWQTDIITTPSSHCGQLMTLQMSDYMVERVTALTIWFTSKNPYALSVIFSLNSCGLYDE